MLDAPRSTFALPTISWAIARYGFGASPRSQVRHHLRLFGPHLAPMNQLADETFVRTHWTSERGNDKTCRQLLVTIVHAHLPPAIRTPRLACGENVRSAQPQIRQTVNTVKNTILIQSIDEACQNNHLTSDVQRSDQLANSFEKTGNRTLSMMLTAILAPRHCIDFWGVSDIYGAASVLYAHILIL